MLARLLSGTVERSLPAEVVVTGLRAYVGLALAFAHGIGKVPPSQRFVRGVEGMGFPAPEVFAWAAGLSELVGGLMLAVGLLTRLGALSVAFTMGVAGFVRHRADPFSDKELALVYFCVALLFVVRGAGRLSVDHLLRGRGGS